MDGSSFLTPFLCQPLVLKHILIKDVLFKVYFMIYKAVQCLTQPEG